MSAPLILFTATLVGTASGLAACAIYLIVTRRVTWHRHEWEKWAVVKRMSITRVRDNSEVGESIHQTRTCKTCGYTQHDRTQIWL